MGVLFKCFGAQFFAIGSLKFIADCAGFASPLLLNGLLAFMENRDEVSLKDFLQTAIKIALCVRFQRVTHRTMLAC